MSKWPVIAMVLWPLAVAPGYFAVAQYAAAPGRPADAPTSWPASLDLGRNPGRATLVMLAHPRCPCTRASLGELGRLMASIEGLADAIVLFGDPAGARWAHTDLWSQAAAIPGVQVREDPGEAIARQLGAWTSGQVLVYDAVGSLVFNGGITWGRGHEGDNLGRSAIQRLLRAGGDHEPIHATSVYGCELRDPEVSR